MPPNCRRNTLYPQIKIVGTVNGDEDEIEEKYGLEDQNEQDNSRISLFEEAEKV